MFVLIVITYLGGATWGPQVSMQEFTTELRCVEALRITLDMTDKLKQANSGGGSDRREVMKAECIRK